MQLAAIYAAIANEGLMMQPHLVSKILDHTLEGRIQSFTPSSFTFGKRVISRENANYLLNLLERNVVSETAALTEVTGYQLAGYFANAAIPDLTGYSEDEFIMTFVGLFPTYDPEFVLLIKLDQPKSDLPPAHVLGPIVQRLMERLVIQLEIPPDDARTSVNNQELIPQNRSIKMDSGLPFSLSVGAIAFLLGVIWGGPFVEILKILKVGKTDSNRTQPSTSTKNWYPDYGWLDDCDNYYCTRFDH